MLTALIVVGFVLFALRIVYINIRYAECLKNGDCKEKEGIAIERQIGIGEEKSYYSYNYDPMPTTDPTYTEDFFPEDPESQYYNPD